MAKTNWNFLVRTLLIVLAIVHGFHRLGKLMMKSGKSGKPEGVETELGSGWS
jgi:hypothetical protein